ncbi:MAG: hypothetical protein HY800_01235, partial [Ignavibacteriales bacterium]|nr:hypothetical protein [Ignavibacteriales bacterium]
MVFLSIHLNAQEDFNLGKRIVGLHVDTSRSNIATIGFDKSLNTYHWAGLAFYNKTIGSTFLQLNQQFLSTLIRTDRKLITDNQTFDFKLRHRLSSNLSAASNLTSFILSDNKSLGSSISKASSHVLYGGIAYQPLEMFVVEPLIGFRL